MVSSPKPYTRPILQALSFFCLLLLISWASYSALWMLDLAPSPAPWELLVAPESRDALSGLGEVIVAVLGIAITVVAIIVELAANRYTPRITELFLRDPVNATILGYFAVTSVLVLWIDVSLYAESAYPTWMATSLLVTMSVAILAILPYFLYVFDFLTPTGIILRIEERTRNALTRRRGGEHDVLEGVEQLGEIALNALDKHEKSIAITTLEALSRVVSCALTSKEGHPEQWFDVTRLADRDPDLVALHPDMVRTLSTRRTWVEMKVYRQFQAIYGNAMNQMQDIGHLVAIHTRRLTVEACDQGDEHAVRLMIRFINTYARSALNTRDIRSAYNLLNEYRILAEDLTRRGRMDLVVEIATRFRYYGQTAFRANLGFILETAAYDLCALLEQVHAEGAEQHDEILSIFLDVDREPEGHRSQETALRGVRKAQVKLACYYLASGETDLARRIYDDMSHENHGRLSSIREELENLATAEFWEVSDRGINFDYLDDARRAHLPEFFSWFA